MNLSWHRMNKKLKVPDVRQR